MIYLAWVLSLVATFFLGYYLRNVVEKINTIEKAVKAKVDKRPQLEEPKSELIDLDDPVKEAMYRHKREMEKLNPNE